MLEETGDGRFKATIEGKEYVFSFFDADKAARTLCDVFATVGEGMHLQGLAEASEGDAQTVYFAMAARSLLTGLGKDSDRSVRLLKRLCCDGVTCDGALIPQETFKTHYLGKMKVMLLVAQAQMQVQFKDFFEPLLSLVGLRRKTASTTSSNTTT